MIRNYIRVAFRSFSKNKASFPINTLGVGISLSCCITAYLLMAFNIEFDNFHKDEKVSNVFRVHTLSTEKNGKVNIDVEAPMTLAPVAASDIAGIQRFTRYLSGNSPLTYQDKSFNENLAFADSSFFELFDYPLLSGDHEFLKDVNSIFLSEELAKKYFGNEDPTGKLMVLNAGTDSQIELLVGGVLKRIPLNTTFRFPALLRIENYMTINKIGASDWSDNHNPSTFLELTDPKNATQVSALVSQYVTTRNRAYTDVAVDSYSLEPFKSAYNEGDIRHSWVAHKMRPASIIIFVAMVLIILAIACFNLTNTSLVMTAKRIKEIGVRKAIGAARHQIIFQFLLEASITISISLIVGLLLAQIIVPAFSNMWNLAYGFEDMSMLNLFIALVIIIFLAALVAGIYPAIWSSRFKPTLLLKGSVKMDGTNFITRSLVGMQFALSVIVLIGGVVFIQNATFQDKIAFGYDKEMILAVTIHGGREFEIMEKAVMSNPEVLRVAACQGNVGGNNEQIIVTVDTSKHSVQGIGVGKNYFETLGLTLAQGRILDLTNASDQHESVVVNKAFVDLIGLKDPLDKIVTIHNKKRRIIGVIENHVDNLWRSEHPEPFVFYPVSENDYATMLVKAEQSDLLDIQKYLQTNWQQVIPGKPFESQFLDDIILGESRRFNTNLEKTFLFITILGGVLSCSGIFALASLNVASRTKEIGIRRVLGASVGSVVGLLNKEFIVVLSVAAVAGSVAGFYFAGTVLGAIYAHYTPVGIMLVIICALSIFLVGIATTSSTIVKAAGADPVTCLRSE